MFQFCYVQLHYLDIEKSEKSPKKITMVSAP